MVKTDKETKATKKRTRVKDIPKPQKELSKDEQQKVKGGRQPSLTDVTDGTSNTIAVGERPL